MYIHGRVEHSLVNGPGARAVIWTQGCTLKCPGCWNAETHAHETGLEISNWNLVQQLLSIEGIEGITFSGGEPMQQAPDLSNVLWGIRRYLPTLSIGMFTGYYLDELEAGKFQWYDPEEKQMINGNSGLWRDIKQSLDFAVMGRYNQRLRTSAQPMCGSTNQALVLFTSFYKRTDFEPQCVEVSISPDGKLVGITGFPSQPDALKELCA